MTFQDGEETRKTTMAVDPICGHSPQANSGEGDRAADRPRGVVEGPVSSPGWSFFFTIMAITILLLGLWLVYFSPHLMATTAEERAVKAEGSAYASQRPEDRDAWNREAYRLRELARSYRSVHTPGVELIRWVTISGLLLNLARRLRTRSALALLQDDPRPPVIYLRSFLVDELDEKAAKMNYYPVPTQEFQLVNTLGKIGPVLAIGRPGEKLSHLGAARVYTSDADWQDIARQLMASARLIVIRAGNTSGVRWELTHARDELPPEKVVLWVGLKGAAYAEFRNITLETLRVELPADLRRHQFVMFDHDWRPRSPSAEVASAEPFPKRSMFWFWGYWGFYYGLKQLASVIARRQDASVMPDSLLRVLEQFQLGTHPPPTFRLLPAAWVLIVLWIALLWLPGQRFWFGLDQVLRELVFNGGDPPHLLGVLIEGAVAMLTALGLAFVPYIRNPNRSWLPSLVLSAVLVVHSYLIVARVPVPSPMANEICRKIVACSAMPATEIETLTDQCINTHMRLHDQDLATLTKCVSLGCSDFGSCYNRALPEILKVGRVGPTPTLPLEKKRRLMQLLCEVLLENKGLIPDIMATDASEKTKELRAAVEDASIALSDPSVMIKLMEEAISTCTADGSEADPVP